MLVDRYGREITYLRISVTDRCNYRCIYCMPPSGILRQDHSEILKYEEILQIANVLVEQGIRRIRLTGGEPLIRKRLEYLVSGLAAIPGVEDISLTTNGVLLSEMAKILAKAGLNRVNISLDTLNGEKFAKITRGGSLSSVLAGIHRAEDAGLAPIKLNAVVIRGINDDEIADLAGLTRDHPWDMRFIELMPVGDTQDWGAGFPAENERFVPVGEMISRLAALDIAEIDHPSTDGPAREFRIPGALGNVGFISPVSDHFCDTCNRLRLTADGNLRPCLLIDREVSLRDALRCGEDLVPLIQTAIDIKPEGHELSELVRPSSRRMVDIGG